jgi:hypothetical protein
MQQIYIVKEHVRILFQVINGDILEAKEVGG